MTSDTLKLYKLIILYFLSKADQEITNAILSDFILEKGYTNYFSIQETLTSLTEDGMIKLQSTHTTSYYTITGYGWETLRLFDSQLPADTKKQIQEYLQDNKMAIVEDTAIRTDYTKTTSGEYLTKCSVIEDGAILYEISLATSTETKAQEICRRFKEKSDVLYTHLLQTLTID